MLAKLLFLAKHLSGQTPSYKPALVVPVLIIPVLVILALVVPVLVIPALVVPILVIIDGFLDTEFEAE